jgi:putative membrane protein
MMPTSKPQQNPFKAIVQFIVDVFRGILMGVAEVLPGISGGTVALIIGIYERIVFSASEAVKGFVLLLSFSKPKWQEARKRFDSIEWQLLLPLLLGMLIGIFASAAAVLPLMETYPSLSFAAFAGLILASLAVPIKLSGGNWGVMEFLFLTLAAVLTFGLTSIPRGQENESSFWFIFISAALAVCALSLPGVSGSNLLIALGMYAPTLAAVNSLDWGFLAVFMLGAIVGFGSFVGVLEWLFENHRKKTLAGMTGLMFGSLASLWPWQDETGANLAAPIVFWPELLAFFIGIAVVATLMLVENQLMRRTRSA